MVTNNLTCHEITTNVMLDICYIYSPFHEENNQDQKRIMIMFFSHSQSEIETKVASFRALLLHQLNSVNNNTENNENVESDDQDNTHHHQEEEGKTVVRDKTG